MIRQRIISLFPVADLSKAGPRSASKANLPNRAIRYRGALGDAIKRAVIASTGQNV